MKLSRSWRAVLGIMVVLTGMAARGENPCANSERRALVLSGGGLKGAFEAGAVYYLVAQRGCDFHDFAGVSVGALNAAILAQARPSDDAAKSHEELIARTEQMVEVWESLKGGHDVVRHRKLGGVRFALLGAENLNDFRPLRHLLESSVSLQDLSHGRPLRVGVTSFADGTYREITVNGSRISVPSARFMDYLYASSMLPVVGKMPRISDAAFEPDDRRATQFADGGLRHVVPVASYFSACEQAPCAHERLQQLFVVGSSPYTRHSDAFAIADHKCCKAGTQVLTNGSRIMRRTIALVADTPYRADLEMMWMANDLLQWRAEMAPGGETGGSFRRPAFPVESFNNDSTQPEAGSKPYRIGFIAPETENVDISDLLSLTPRMVREQLLAGCLAADRMMQSEFGLASESDGCEQRFGVAPQREPVRMASR